MSGGSCSEAFEIASIGRPDAEDARNKIRIGVVPGFKCDPRTVRRPDGTPEILGCPGAELDWIRAVPVDYGDPGENDALILASVLALDLAKDRERQQDRD